MAADVALGTGRERAPLDVPASAAHDASWRRSLAAFALCFATAVAVYFETVLDLWQEWGATGTYAHGYFIFPISAWLIWRSRAELARVVPQVQPWALVPLVACGPLWLAGHSAGVHPVVQYAFVAMIPCLVWGIFGNDVTRRILYPPAFLFFAVPTGEFLLPTLMDHTADFTIAALRLSGVPVFREGNFFSIPSGNWSVIEACSGIRYLIASITLGFLFAYLNYRATWRRVAFIAAAIVVPIVANWLRAYMIVMIAHLSSNKLATGVDHLVYGWLFFGIVMLALFWFGNLWRDDDEMDQPRPSDAPIAQNTPATPRAVALMAAALIVVIAPWPAVGGRVEAIADAVHPGTLVIDAIPGWREVSPTVTFKPNYVQARSTQMATFASGPDEVGLFVAYYSGQLSNGLMITVTNDLLLTSNKGWGAVSRRARNAAADGSSFAVDETEVRGLGGTGDLRFVTWRWYWINGRLTTNKYVAKAWNAIDKITGRGDDSAVIVVSAKMAGPDDPAAARRLETFVAAAEPVIRARLDAFHDEARR
jgi:exosortase A